MHPIRMGWEFETDNNSIPTAARLGHECAKGGDIIQVG